MSILPNSQRDIIQTSQLERTFLRCYLFSNVQFPQTRFYFILDFGARTSDADLASVLTSGILIRSSVVSVLAKKTNTVHQKYRIPKVITEETIRQDIMKMLGALVDCYRQYTSANPDGSLPNAFSADCEQVKREIDRRRLSEQFLEFVSPARVRNSTTAQVVRSPNDFATKRLAPLFREHPYLRNAIEEHLLRSLWVLRGSGKLNDLG